MSHEIILILDFGSQYNQLIARRVRENKVYCKLVPHDITPEQIRSIQPKGLILSGGPASVFEHGAPKCKKEIFELGIPVLGICYGLQIMAQSLDGQVGQAGKREYGKTELKIDDKKDLFKGIPSKIISWMSHGDYVKKLPKGFKAIAHTKNTKAACIANKDKKLFGVQFHPEVSHTQHGEKILKNFLHNVCGCKGAWTMKSFEKEAIKSIRKTVGRGRVVLGLSGGVDSSVAAVLLNKAIGKKLVCVFVDNGLLRKGEAKLVRERFAKHFKINLKVVDAEKRFLGNLKGVQDPERKRKIIGETFIRVFEDEAKKLGRIDFLAQGTLYPDVIESKSAFGGPSATIKTHHNVGGLPEKMHFKLIEPLRELFKDEVRLLGKEMGMLDELVWRHPFPGPGLAVRILGEVTKEKCDMLREADERIIDEIKNAGLYRSIWQVFGVFIPVKTVGVMGDQRTYENVVAVRAVTSKDGMTADWAKIPYEVLQIISNRIINEVRGINRVVYDISSKPPSTIEWE